MAIRRLEVKTITLTGALDTPRNTDPASIITEYATGCTDDAKIHEKAPGWALNHLREAKA